MEEEGFLRSFKRFLFALVLTFSQIVSMPVDMSIKFLESVNHWSRRKIERYKINKALINQDIGHEHIEDAIDEDTRRRIEKNG